MPRAQVEIPGPGAIRLPGCSPELVDRRDPLRKNMYLFFLMASRRNDFS